MRPTALLRQMPPFQGTPCVRTDTGAAVLAMPLPGPFDFRLPDEVSDDGRILGEGGWCRGTAGAWLVSTGSGRFTVLPAALVRAAP